MTTPEYTRIICDVWTHWRHNPIAITIITALGMYKYAMADIIYESTGKKYFITQNDSDIFNKIIDSLYGGNSDLGYGPGFSGSSDEYIYDMTDTTIINNPDFVFDRLIEIFLPNLIVKRYHLPPLEYAIYVFDVILSWSDFRAIKSRFLLFGESYIDPILSSIANPPKPGMVRGVKTLRELSYDAVDGNYGGFAPKINAETFSQATYTTKLKKPKKY